MTLLLDTHIWLWSLLEPERIGPKLKRMLQRNDSQHWLSPISTWELTVLAASGRIQLHLPAARWIAEAMAAAPFREAPLTHEIVLALGEIVLPHRDPADRFLAATARILDCPLATADAEILAGSGFRCVENR